MIAHVLTWAHSFWICTYVAMQTSHACFVYRLLILFQLSNLTENQQVNFFPCWAALDYLELASMSANTMIFNTVISA